MGRLVWAFEPLEETEGETGFVELADEAAAEALIEAGKVQCGWNPAGGELRALDSAAIAAYGTRQLRAGGPRAHGGAAAEPEPHDPEPAEERPAEPGEAPAPGKKRGRPPKGDK